MVFRLTTVMCLFPEHKETFITECYSLMKLVCAYQLSVPILNKRILVHKILVIPS